MELPDHAEAALRDAWSDLPRAALQSLAVEGYRTGKFSCVQVGQMLGHENRWESEEFLADHGVWPGTNVEEFGSDLAALDRLKRR